MRQRRLRWFGHIERREDKSWLKKVQILAVDDHSGRGRPRKTWELVIMEDLRVKGLRREVAQNRALGDSVFTAPSISSPNEFYLTNMNDGFCTCMVGRNGAPCKHQYLMGK